MILNRGCQQERDPGMYQRWNQNVIYHSKVTVTWKRCCGKLTDHEFVIRQKGDSKHSSRMTTIQFIYWQRMLAERILTTVVRGSQCIYVQHQKEQTNKQTFTNYTKQISKQNVCTSLLFNICVPSFPTLIDSCPEGSSVLEQQVMDKKTRKT